MSLKQERLEFAKSLTAGEFDLACVLMDELRTLRGANKPFDEIEFRLTQLAEITRKQQNLRVNIEVEIAGNIGKRKGDKVGKRYTRHLRKIA
jgi:hypothetical protein